MSEPMRTSQTVPTKPRHTGTQAHRHPGSVFLVQTLGMGIVFYTHGNGRPLTPQS